MGGGVAVRIAATFRPAGHLPPTPSRKGRGSLCLGLCLSGGPMNEMSRRLLPPADSEEPTRPRAHRAGPFGVLDIGTTKVACLIGRTESDGSLRVLGFGWQRGRGVNSGDITDLEAAEKAIRASVGQAEDMADVRLRSVTINLTCGQPESRLFNLQW